MSHRYRRLIWVPLVLLCITSCEGSEGPAGPTGPMGEQGPPGPAGAPGEPGAVDVVVRTITIGEGDFSGDPETAGYSMPEITAEVEASGTVLAFLGQSGAWMAMPFSVHVQGASVTMGYGYGESAFVLTLASSLDSAIGYIFEDFQVRVVILPPSASKQDYQDMTYDELRARFGLPE